MIKIGIICPSEIAFRRFLPALSKNTNFAYTGVACASKDEWYTEQENSEKKLQYLIESEHEKAENFRKQYGGIIFNSYSEMIHSGKIEAIYIPLPPALHYKWAKESLEAGLHVFVEKPSTTGYKYTKELVNIAHERKLALHENYMFIYHSQIDKLNKIILSGEIGEVRLIRIDFGFPAREKNDFRYVKKMGGGALLDCGGYTMKYADYLLGGNSNVTCASVGYSHNYAVEIFGSATLKNDKNQIAQVSFGMDNDYRCSLEVWGSKGTLRSGRVLTAPDGFVPSCSISKNGKTENFSLEADDAFLKSINRFSQCITDDISKEDEYRILIKQEKLVNDFAALAGINLEEYK